METFTKQSILTFLEQTADFITHDIVSDDYTQKVFTAPELDKLFAKLFNHPESKLNLFKQYLKYC
jgi:hypothetical protein